MPEFPDWLRGLALLGQDGTDYVVIKVASTGELYTLIQGMHAGSPVTVAVDADGNILAVLKGEFGGNLVTVKLDAEGRLFTYVTDEIDQWGNILPGGFNELAARLGAPTAYERRGQVVLAETFSGGLGGWRLGGSAGYSALLDPTDFYRDGYSLDLQAVLGASEYVNVSRKWGVFPATTGIGLSCWVHFYDLPAMWYLRISLEDGTTQHIGMLRGLLSDGKVYAATTGGAYTEIGTWYTGTYADDCFRFLKFAMDLATGKYLYHVVDGTEFDTSAIDYQKSNSSNKLLVVQFVAYSDASNQAKVRVDNFVLTAREHT